MKVRIEQTKEFYATAVSWWNMHDFPPPHIVFLPQKVFVVSENNNDLYAMFVYETDSGLLFIAFPIRNKKFPQNETAFSYLLSEIEKWALKRGYSYLYTTSPISYLDKLFLSKGFVYGDKNVNQYIKVIS